MIYFIFLIVCFFSGPAILFAVAIAKRYSLGPSNGARVRRVQRREREANRLLVAADPEFARSLGIVVPPSPLPSLPAAKAFATLFVSIRAIAAKAGGAGGAFAAVGRRGPAAVSRLPRRGNLSSSPGEFEMPPLAQLSSVRPLPGIPSWESMDRDGLVRIRRRRVDADGKPIASDARISPETLRDLRDLWGVTVVPY